MLYWNSAFRNHARLKRRFVTIATELAAPGSTRRRPRSRQNTLLAFSVQARAFCRDLLPAPVLTALKNSPQLHELEKSRSGGGQVQAQRPTMCEPRIVQAGIESEK